MGQRPLPLRACLVLALLAIGCATPVAWHRLEPPVALKPAEIVWIWTGAAVRKWHAVAITQDSVVGVPYDLPLSCDSCRQSLARSRVDSMEVPYQPRVGSRPARPWVVAGIVVAALLVEVGVCTLIHAHDSC